MELFFVLLILIILDSENEEACLAEEKRHYNCREKNEKSKKWLFEARDSVVPEAEEEIQ